MVTAYVKLPNAIQNGVVSSTTRKRVAHAHNTTSRCSGGNITTEKHILYSPRSESTYTEAIENEKKCGPIQNRLKIENTKIL